MSDYHHGDLRNALLAEAGAVLEEEGADAVTFRGLARRIGVSHAAPSYHFEDRDLLMVEVAAEGHEMLEAAMRTALAEGVADTDLVAIGIGYLRFALDNPNRFRLMFAGCAGLDPQRSERFVTASTTSFRTLLTVAGGGPDASPDEQLHGPWLRAWAVVHGLATLYIDGAVGPYLGDRAGYQAHAEAELRAVLGD